jgi:tetratricopeptide (TPR) repeat protein
MKLILRIADLYQSAAFEAQRAGDLARALGITEKISNLEFRRQVRAWIHFNAAQTAIGEKRFDEARRYALEVDATDQRAYLFFEIARAALKEKDRARAVELLDEAAQKAAAAENTPEKLRALLGITSLYASFDPLRGFEVMAEAARTANKVSDYGPDQARLLRTLTTPGGYNSMLSVQDVEGFNLGKTLASLARTDFDRALLIAQSLENKPLRLTTIAAVAASPFAKKQSAPPQ